MELIKTDNLLSSLYRIQFPEKGKRRIARPDVAWPKRDFPTGVCRGADTRSDDLAGTVHARQRQPGRDRTGKSGRDAGLFQTSEYAADRRDRESEVRNRPYSAGFHDHEPGFPRGVRAPHLPCAGCGQRMLSNESGGIIMESRNRRALALALAL